MPPETFWIMARSPSLLPKMPAKGIPQAAIRFTANGATQSPAWMTISTRRDLKRSPARSMAVRLSWVSDRMPMRKAGQSLSRWYSRLPSPRTAAWSS